MAGTTQFAGIWREGTDPGTDPYYLWVATWDSFAAKWGELSRTGLRLVDLDVTVESGVPLYAGVWRAGSDAHYLWVDADWLHFEAKWKALSEQSLRLVSLSTYSVEGTTQFAGVWREGSDGYALWVGATWEEFVAKWQAFAEQSLRLVDLAIYEEQGDARYAGVWREGNDAYYLWVGADLDHFIAKWQALGQQGLRLVDLEVEQLDGATRYSGTWRAGNDRAYLWVEADLDHFVAKWQELAAQGLRLVGIDMRTPEPAFAPRPFYVIGHNPNTLHEVREALARGANALEPDVNVYDNSPEDLCISHGEGGDEAPSLVDFLKGLHDLASQLGSALALVVFDCKPPVATPAHGERLLSAIRQHLTYDLDLTIVISVAKIAHGAIFDHIAGGLRAREGASIDAEDDPVAVANYLANRGIAHACYGNGLSVLNSITGPYYRYTLEHACELKAAQFRPRFVYAWTVNDGDEIREYLRVGVDGLISDDVAKVRSIVSSEFAGVCSLAQRSDNPLVEDVFGYGLIVDTGDVWHAGTDANVTFTLHGATGSASKTVNTRLIKRMERNERNFVTIPSRHLGALSSITVQRDDQGNAPDWMLLRIFVRSHRYGVSGQAEFNCWIDSTAPFTRALA